MEKHSDIRERILETAQRLFYNQGYNSTGINQIIEEAGIAKASLYQHFKSKDALLVAYLQRNHRERIQRLWEFINKCEDPAARLGAMFEYRISVAEEGQFRGCSFMRIHSELDMCYAKDRAQAEIRQYKNEVLGIIRSLVNKLPLKKEVDPDLLSERIFMIYEGAQINSTLLQRAEPLKQGKALVMEMIS